MTIKYSNRKWKLCLKRSPIPPPTQAGPKFNREKNIIQTHFEGIDFLVVTRVW